LTRLPVSGITPHAHFFLDEDPSMYAHARGALRLRVPVLLLLGLLSGCGTTHSTDTTRSATEQMLLSSAIDQTVSRMDFRFLDGQKVFFDPQYLDGPVDKGYLISSLRQHLLACGALLQEERKKATIVVEARSGTIGTDRHSLLVGVPQMNMPVVVPGAPSTIPEIPFAKRTDQNGVAKVSVFAYNRETGERVWQSGTQQARATAKDLWVLGAGPFQNGTIRKGNSSVGDLLPVNPFESDKELAPVAGVSVSQQAAWKATRTAEHREPERPGKEPPPVTPIAVTVPTSLPSLARPGVMVGAEEPSHSELIPPQPRLFNEDHGR
jgi:hypothetical protein